LGMGKVDVWMVGKKVEKLVDKMVVRMVAL
jgi:hypothetical protein